MMIPFVCKGSDQLAKRIKACPATGDNEMYGGAEGPKKKMTLYARN